MQYLAKDDYIQQLVFKKNMNYQKSKSNRNINHSNVCTVDLQEQRHIVKTIGGLIRVCDCTLRPEGK